MLIKTLLLLLLAWTTSACPTEYPGTNLTHRTRRFVGPWFSNSKDGLWPRHATDQGRTIIPYCYANRAAEDALAAHVHSAWAVWVHALGSAGPASGHSLDLTDYARSFRPGSPRYCYLESGAWNPVMPEHAVVVRRSVAGAWAAASSLGFSRVGGAGRHYISIGDAGMAPNRDLTWVVAHELGHVFGLMHEHQRADRDDYVQFNCVNLAGYAEALRRATADGFTKDELCNIFNVANHYGFAATQYVRWVTHGVMYSGDYDYDSIMHYPSWMSHDGSLTRLDPGNADFWPLARLTGGKGGWRSFLPLPRPYPYFSVSYRDADAIRQFLYPWN